MFDSSPDISSDVEWALRSGQTSTQDLALVLVENFGKTIHWLSISLFGHGNSAYDFTIDVFAAALLNVHRFETSPYSKLTDQAPTNDEKNMAIKQWLFSLAFDRLHQKRWISRIPPENSPWLAFVPAVSLDDPDAATLIWHAWESLNRPERLTAMLYFVFDCPAADIASFVQTSENSVNSFLDGFRTEAKSVLSEPNGDDIPSFDNYIREILQKEIHEVEPPLPDWGYLARQAVARAGSLSIRRRLFISSAEILSVLVAILVVGSLFWGYNRYAPLPQPTPTPTNHTSEIAAPTSQLQTLRGTGSTTRPTTSVVDVKEMTVSNSPDISSGNLYSLSQYRSYRWISGGWKTIWVDAIFNEYDNSATNFNPTVTRLQAWISKNHLLVLKGSPTGTPDRAILAQLDNQHYYSARPNDQNTQYQDVEQSQFFSSTLIENYLTRLTSSFSPYTRRGENSFQTIRVDNLNGREVEVFEGRNPDGWLISRLWVDRHGGLVLRNQRYSGDASEKLLVEIDVTGVAYDVEFPHELFDPSLPWRGGFAQDYTGKPESIYASRSLPAATINSGAVFLPAGVVASELAESQFNFKFPNSSDLQQSAQTADLYSAGFYLGKVVLGDPARAICDRSPDRKIFAFVSNPSSLDPFSTYLNWFMPENYNLIVQKTLESVSIQNFAFAPDSQRIAFFGDEGNRKGLFIYDLVKNKLEFLLQIETAHSIVWRSDGKYLLLLGQQPDRPGEENVFKVDVNDGQGVLIQLSEFISGKVLDWPGIEWGVNFPVEQRTLGDCAEIEISSRSYGQ